MKPGRLFATCGLAILLAACAHTGAKEEEARELEACKEMVLHGLLKIRKPTTCAFRARWRRPRRCAAAARKRCSFGCPRESTGPNIGAPATWSPYPRTMCQAVRAVRFSRTEVLGESDQRTRQPAFGMVHRKALQALSAFERALHHDLQQRESPATAASGRCLQPQRHSTPSPSSFPGRWPAPACAADQAVRIHQRNRPCDKYLRQFGARQTPNGRP